MRISYIIVSLFFLLFIYFFNQICACLSCRSDAPKTEKQKRNLSDSEDDKCETILESSHPPKQQSMELQKLKANCKPEDLLKLKQKCEVRRSIIMLV